MAPESPQAPDRPQAPDAPQDPGSALVDDLGGLVVAVDHVGLAVPDLDAAVEFWCGTFGLVERHREVNAEQGVAEAMLAPAAGPTGEAATTQLQLLAPLSPESPIARFLDRSGPGLQQLAYQVRDVAHAAQVLQGKGVRLLYDSPRRGTANSLINFVHPKDTGGVLIELVQPAPPGGTD